MANLNAVEKLAKKVGNGKFFIPMPWNDPTVVKVEKAHTFRNLSAYTPLMKMISPKIHTFIPAPKPDYWGDLFLTLNPSAKLVKTVAVTELKRTRSDSMIVAMRNIVLAAANHVVQLNEMVASLSQSFPERTEKYLSSYIKSALKDDRFYKGMPISRATLIQ